MTGSGESIADPPDWLDELQAATWREAVALAPSTLLAIDRHVLAILCVAATEYRRAAVDARQHGENQSLLLSIMNEQATVALKVAGELGFSARAVIALLDLTPGKLGPRRNLGTGPP